MSDSRISYGDWCPQRERSGIAVGRPPLRLLPAARACLALYRSGPDSESRDRARPAVPIDLRALNALKGSPLALDIYSWLTYRMSYLRKPCLLLLPSTAHVPKM